MTSPLIPRRVLFGNPDKVSPQISPDGKYLAYIAPTENVLNLCLRDLQAPEAGEKDTVLTHDKDRGIRSYFWAEDSQHLLYVQDKGGNENWRLYGLDIQSGTIKDYTPFDTVQTQIIQKDKHHPNSLLIALNKDNPQLHDVYHLDLSSGALVKIAENPGNIVGWVSDANLQVRAAVAAQPDGSMRLLYRENTDSDWETLMDWGMEDSLNSSPSHFSKDGAFLYLLNSKDVNAAQLTALDVKTREEKVLASDPQYDIAGVFVDGDTYEVQAANFNRARSEWEILDPAIAEDFAFLSAYNRGDFTLINRDNANTTWLVAFEFDNAPVEYYVYHRAEKTLDFLFVHNSALAEYTLAEMEPMSYTTRDGLTVHGYITYPVGVERQSLPMVLYVHGGPWWRDEWGYDPNAQWLANRGYVCLQVNYRGSTGYGKAFLNAGDREWGGKMHDDLIDAVDWAVQSGGVDAKRVAIYGGSYGGYAALVGATFTPESFRCAIDMVGPSSLITLIESFPPYWASMLNNFKQRVGDPDTEPEFLKSRSPLYKVDQIQIPLFIAQGANDPRVTQQEADQIVKVLQEKGLDYQYQLFEDEGHGLAKPENRMTFFEAVEPFLAKYLGGRVE
jgi:dipeptidyl aminopeptidase/acylaminoacyl peptidase